MRSWLMVAQGFALFWMTGCSQVESTESEASAYGSDVQQAVELSLHDHDAVGGLDSVEDPGLEGGLSSVGDDLMSVSVEPEHDDGVSGSEVED